MKNAYPTRRLSPEGYSAITKPLAKELYNQGFDVTMCGNNVNSFHIFKGWYLGYTVSKERTEQLTSLPYDFSDLVNNFLFYLDTELGYYPVFYVKSEDLQAYQGRQTRQTNLDNKGANKQ